MTGFVVAEGAWDKQLLQLVLAAQGVETVHVVDGQGRSSAVSLACSILARRHQPVILVVDADSVVNRQVAVQEQDLESLLKYAGPRELWQLVLCRPELEIVLFDAGTFSIVENTFGLALNERQKAVAPYDPRSVLKELGEATGKAWREELISYLSAHPAACRKIGETPTLKPMIDFFRQHLRAAA